MKHITKRPASCRYFLIPGIPLALQVG